MQEQQRATLPTLAQVNIHTSHLANTVFYIHH
jgi:hypothetical protein